MKTIIFDIDGTITNMWPIEKSVLLSMLGKEFDSAIEAEKSAGISDTYKIFLKFSKKHVSKKIYNEIYDQAFSRCAKDQTLPALKGYPVVGWIISNQRNYRFVYATGGQKNETYYVLESLGLGTIFDLKNSLDRSNCRYSKSTGIPFKKLKWKYPDCILVTDSKSDCSGASLANIPYIQIEQDIYSKSCCCLQKKLGMV